MKKTAIGIVFSIFSLAANANFVETDWLSENDSLSTLDVATGLEWMDLTVTRGDSVDTVSSQIVAGGNYEGWRFPTAVEMDTLFRNLFTTAYSSFTSSSGKINLGANGSKADEAIQMAQLFGDGVLASGYSYPQGWSDGQKLKGSGVSLQSGSWYGHGPLAGGGYYEDSIFSKKGTYLVSDGGVTMSSLLDPSLNQANPNSPFNSAPISDVPLAGSAFSIIFGILVFSRRKNKKR
jgi:hypothetical protein